MLQSLRTLLKSVPRLIIETLYFWTIRSGFLYIKVETDLDDGVVLEDHCDFIVKILGVILQSNMRHIEQDFTIDLRNFGNFQLQDYIEQNEEELMDMGIIFVLVKMVVLKVTEETVTENATIMKISEHFAEFLKSAENLETFSPGLFVTDRSQDCSEPRKLSLCFKYKSVTFVDL